MISLFLLKIPDSLVFLLPPDIEPVLLIISPSKVTILNVYLNLLAIFIPESRLSTTTTLPKKLSIIPLYKESTFTKSEAIPIKPFWFFSSFKMLSSKYLPLTEEMGRNVALPIWFFFKNSMALLASSSVLVTIF